MIKSISQLIFAKDRVVNLNVPFCISYVRDLWPDVPDLEGSAKKPHWKTSSHIIWIHLEVFNDIFYTSSTAFLNPIFGSQNWFCLFHKTWLDLHSFFLCSFPTMYLSSVHSNLILWIPERTRKLVYRATQHFESYILLTLNWKLCFSTYKGSIVLWKNFCQQNIGLKVLCRPEPVLNAGSLSFSTHTTSTP